MAGREQPYDPYIPSGSSGQGGNGQYEGGNTRTAAIQSVCDKCFAEYKFVAQCALQGYLATTCERLLPYA